MSYLEVLIKKNDLVQPGEQWFFYWKTSAALWESKILQFAPAEVVFIPVHWGFHAESPTEWDFGRIHPERDFKRLCDLLTRHGRKFCFLLPLTPAPFLINGGVPVSAARTLSISRDGGHLAVLDQESNLNKVFSFFEPKVFKTFNQFVEAFGRFLTSNKIQAPVWGAQFYYQQDQKKYSYLEDHSLAFDQGFSRYLKQNYPNGTNLTQPKDEWEYKDNFTLEVSNLFKTSAESALAPFWMGTQKIVTLGGSPQETILRSLPSGKSQLDFTKDLFHHFIHKEWISSALLTPNEKKETLSGILKEHFGGPEIDQVYQFQINSSGLTSEFKPFGVIDLFDSKNQKHFELLGLINFLNQNFRWLYQSHEELLFKPSAIDGDQHKIKFFHGRDLDRTTFSQLLKLFMMGQRVLLDISGLPEGLDKKLQIFLLENNLKSQSINFMTFTQLCELGEGRLILFEGDKLVENPGREKFWSNIFKYFHLVQPQMLMDEDVFSMWRIRATSPHELSYLDVRRVNIYNPTSYRKVVSIKTHKHFAFMKMIDPNRASAKSTPEGVDVELLPNGTIALDFGHYEEN